MLSIASQVKQAAAPLIWLKKDDCEAAVPEMAMANLRELIISRLLAELPQYNEASLYFEGMSMVTQKADEIMALCRRDPRASLEGAISSASSDLRTRFSFASERVESVRALSGSKSSEKKSSKKTVVLKKAIKVGKVATATSAVAQLPIYGPIMPEDMMQIEMQSGELFEELALPHTVRYVETGGQSFWRFELDEHGRYALVPIENIQSIDVTEGKEDMLVIERHQSPMMRFGTLQSERQRIELPVSLVATIAGASSADSLRERLHRQQQLIEELIAAYREEQERQFDALMEGRQCALHGLSERMEVNDLWALPDSFSPDETPLDPAVPLLMPVHQ